MTFLSNSIGAIKGGGSSVCWDSGGSWFKSRFWIFVKLLHFFWDLQSAISYIRIYQQGALYCACICCFTKKRGNKFSSEASRQKVKHVLVHPGSPESLALPCFVGSHFLSDLLKCLSVWFCLLLDLEEEDSLNMRCLFVMPFIRWFLCGDFLQPAFTKLCWRWNPLVCLLPILCWV